MKIAALAGGVGAARLLSGLVAVMPQEDLTVIVNTGDDFRWLDLLVCPDIDTII
jgi:LPPG:FO 2-phospho-L-lactate transferase